jgi:chemotaxis family two-component system response regulator Rcp1
MTINILLVEDNVGDARLMKEVLLQANKTVHLDIVGDGVEALAYLKYQGNYLEAPRPDLILLDLHLPKMDGLSVLADIKGDSRLRTIPIIILTSSRSDLDIAKSYSLFANCYLTKPSNLIEFERLVASLNDFWLTRVRFEKPAPLAPQTIPVIRRAKRKGLLN